MEKKRLLTGLQPSGNLHIGNYFGALKPFYDSYQDYESFLMVVDYHALTSLKDGELLRSNIISAVKDYLAVGVDPKQVTLFKQSDVSEHTELAWILDCLVTVPFLMQAHSYKDKVAKGLEANAGLFTYPMLMAADILLYDTDVVPVGEDQRQHLEYAREAAAKFNAAFGKKTPLITPDLKIGDPLNTGPYIEEFFKEPKELILKKVGIIPGTDGAKMSKSYKNTIPLFGTKDEVAKAVMSIVTDSASETPVNVHAIHELFTDEASLAKLYKEKRGQYKDLKEALIEDIDSALAPMRERRAHITDDDVRTVLKAGAVRAKEVAGAKMTDVRMKIGVTI